MPGSAFHTVILHKIPALSMERLPEVRRLITLIDVLYDHQVKVMCSAAQEPFKLFTADKNASQDEAFAFDRTASRLQDMMSQVPPPPPCLPPPCVPPPCMSPSCLLPTHVSPRREDLKGRWSRRAGAWITDGWVVGTKQEYMVKMHNPPSQSVDDTRPDARAVSAPLTELHHELTEKEVSVSLTEKELHVFGCAHAWHGTSQKRGATARHVMANGPTTPFVSGMCILIRENET